MAPSRKVGFCPRPSFIPTASVTPRFTMASSSRSVSHGDTVFGAVVARLPVELRDAMLENGLDNPGVLRHYPRATLHELGLSEWSLQYAGGAGMATGMGTLTYALSSHLFLVCSLTFCVSRFSRLAVLLTGPTQA